MNIKTRLNNLNSETFIDDYLESCGVIDVNEFKNPTGKYVQDPNEYVGIKYKSDMFFDIIKGVIL